jgi:hypothetical protein
MVVGITPTCAISAYHQYGFVNYKKECTRLAVASDTVYQLLAHDQWFSLGTPASSTTETGRDVTCSAGKQQIPIL